MRRLILGLLIGVGLGFGIAYKLYRPKVIIETYQAEIRQADGSLILERKPGFKIVKPVIPEGATLTRQAEIIIQPTAKDCPEVRVDLALVRLSDQSFRIIANSPDGKIVGGIDVPIQTQLSQDLKWSLGGIYKPNGYGVFLERALGPLMVGIDITRNRTPMESYTLDYALRVGVRF